MKIHGGFVMANKVYPINFRELVPLFDEDTHREACDQADYFGMDSLTESQQYLVDTYHRMKAYVDQLPEAEAAQLLDMEIEDKTDIYREHEMKEMKFYKSTHKMSNESRMQQASDLVCDTSKSASMEFGAN